MKYTCLLFDADGTLFDYDQAETRALQATFENCGQAFHQAWLDDYKKINQNVWLEFEKGVLAADELKIKRFRLLLEKVNIEADPKTFSQNYLKNLAGQALLLEGVEDTIRSLHGIYRMAIITNGLSQVQRSRFKKSTIGAYFAEVIISEEVGAAKPDTKIFDIAFSRMDFPRKEDVLIIGDSLTSDIQGGCNYGIDTCWINPGKTGRQTDLAIQYEIKCLPELVNILD